MRNEGMTRAEARPVYTGQATANSEVDVALARETASHRMLQQGVALVVLTALVAVSVVHLWLGLKPAGLASAAIGLMLTGAASELMVYLTDRRLSH